MKLSLAASILLFASPQVDDYNAVSALSIHPRQQHRHHHHQHHRRESNTALSSSAFDQLASVAAAAPPAAVANTNVNGFDNEQLDFVANTLMEPPSPFNQLQQQLNNNGNNGLNNNNNNGPPNGWPALNNNNKGMNNMNDANINGFNNKGFSTSNTNQNNNQNYGQLPTPKGWPVPAKLTKTSFGGLEREDTDNSLNADVAAATNGVKGGASSATVGGGGGANSIKGFQPVKGMNSNGLKGFSNGVANKFAMKQMNGFADNNNGMGSTKGPAALNNGFNKAPGVNNGFNNGGIQGLKGQQQQQSNNGFKGPSSISFGQQKSNGFRAPNSNNNGFNASNGAKGPSFSAPKMINNNGLKGPNGVGGGGGTTSPKMMNNGFNKAPTTSQQVKQQPDQQGGFNANLLGGFGGANNNKNNNDGDGMGFNNNGPATVAAAASKGFSSGPSSPKMNNNGFKAPNKEDPAVSKMAPKMTNNGLNKGPPSSSQQSNGLKGTRTYGLKGPAAGGGGVASADPTSSLNQKSSNGFQVGGGTSANKGVVAKGLSGPNILSQKSHGYAFKAPAVTKMSPKMNNNGLKGPSTSSQQINGLKGPASGGGVASDPTKMTFKINDGLQGPSSLNQESSNGFQVGGGTSTNKGAVAKGLSGPKMNNGFQGATSKKSNGLKGPPPSLSQKSHGYAFKDPSPQVKQQLQPKHISAPPQQQQPRQSAPMVSNQQQLAPQTNSIRRVSSSPNNNNYNHRGVMTGRERRSSFESYATPDYYSTYETANIGDDRTYTVGSVIGSPNGMGEWGYSSSYGPATTSHSGQGSRGTTSYSNSRSSFDSPIQNGGSAAYSASYMDGGLMKNNGNVGNTHTAAMTGGQHRSSFSSFDPFSQSQYEQAYQGNNHGGQQQGSSDNAYDNYTGGQRQSTFHSYEPSVPFAYEQAHNQGVRQQQQQQQLPGSSTSSNVGAGNAVRGDSFNNSRFAPSVLPSQGNAQVSHQQPQQQGGVAFSGPTSSGMGNVRSADGFNGVAPPSSQQQQSAAGSLGQTGTNNNAMMGGATLRTKGAKDVADELSSLASPPPPTLYNDFESSGGSGFAPLEQNEFHDKPSAQQHQQEEVDDASAIRGGRSAGGTPSFAGLASTNNNVAKGANHDELNFAISNGAVQNMPSVSDVPMDTPARQSLPPYLSLHPIPGKGLGVITSKSFAIGEFVGNYEGEVMSEEVKDRRYLSSLKDTLTDEDRVWIQNRLERGQTLTACYLYGVDKDAGNVYGHFGRNKESNNIVEEEPERIFVDAEDEYESLWTRFINHAPPPLDNLKPMSVPESYDGQPRVWFMAKRDIEAGEELCFNYGEDYWLEGDEVF